MINENAVRSLIGIPYANLGRGPHYDCYGFCIHAAKLLYNIDLPDYRYSDSDNKVVAALTIFSGCTDDHWKKAIRLLPGDIIIFRIGKFACHCGIYIGDDEFLHCLRGRMSTKERLVEWENQIYSTWRYSPC